jgi:putative transposase
MSRQTSRGDAAVGQLRTAFAVSRQAWHAARKRRDAPPRPPRGPRPPRRRPDSASAEAVTAAIVVLAKDNPGWGVPKVWANLRYIQGLVVGRRRVYALMKSLGLLLPPARKESRPASRGHVSVPQSNRRWATDLTTTWTGQDGLVAIITVIDCGDRTVLDVEVSKSQDAPSTLLPVERALFQAFAVAGTAPDGLELLSDHGPQYTGRDCEELCDRWRVHHRFSGVGRPTGNAIAERLILTLKVELIWTRDWVSIDELRAAVRTWARRYNEQRPHEALNWKTPAQKRELNLNPPQREAA